MIGYVLGSLVGVSALLGVIINRLGSIRDELREIRRGQS